MTNVIRIKKRRFVRVRSFFRVAMQANFVSVHALLYRFAETNASEEIADDFSSSLETVQIRRTLQPPHESFASGRVPVGVETFQYRE